MNKDSTVEDKYAKAEDDAKKHNDAILESPSKKKVVVAGPGTGKTYLFKTILAVKSKTLTLTFVNALKKEATFLKWIKEDRMEELGFKWNEKEAKQDTQQSNKP